MGYLWIKALHIFFVASWFAGLFYLPRIYVNLAMETDKAATARLLTMARKLYRFMTILAIPALVLGMWLWLGYGVGKGPGSGWMHAKLAIVVFLVFYHHGCGVLLRKFENGTNTHSHKWYRWFNEAPTLGLLGAVVLVVLKPF
jgi:protoporphyrinogen IX oxidase